MIISCDCATQTQIQIQHFFAFLQKKNLHSGPNWIKLKILRNLKKNAQWTIRFQNLAHCNLIYILWSIIT